MFCSRLDIDVGMFRKKQLPKISVDFLIDGQCYLANNKTVDNRDEWQIIVFLAINCDITIYGDVVLVLQKAPKHAQI